MAGQKIRVVDPVLTTHAQGYQNGEYVGDELFPHVPVNARGGKVIEFDKAAFKLYRSKRARGAKTTRIQFGYEGKPFALDQDSIEGKVPVEDLDDAKAVPGIDLGMEQADLVMDVIQLGKEYEKASIARDPDNYDADHKVDLAAAKWSDDANDPIKDLKAGKEAIRQSIGMYPNKVVFSPKAWSALTENANVKERYKHTTSQSITTDMIANALEIKKIVVGTAVFADDNDEMNDVWGQDVVMAYVSPVSSGKGVKSKRVPSFAYTYHLKGHPLVRKPYFDEPEQSWIYPVVDESTPTLTGMAAGYLFQNVA